MDILDHVEPERWLAIAPAPQAVQAGCKGAACPFFATCEGRCAKKRAARGKGFPARPRRA
jgi:radical SAM protein with 4Fe4S-binding SPASM domain